MIHKETQPNFVNMVKMMIEDENGWGQVKLLNMKLCTKSELWASLAASKIIIKKLQNKVESSKYIHFDIIYKNKDKKVNQKSNIKAKAGLSLSKVK